MYNLYIAGSTQKHNVGVGQYGTEQDQMMFLADRVKYWLETQGIFKVHRNKPNWSLQQTVAHCNSLQCILFLDNHTNAGKIKELAGDGGAEGTEVFYYHQAGTTSNSYKLAKAVYEQIAPLSPGKDRGILPDNRYTSSIFVIQKTNPPATLIEHIFHTNHAEVKDFLARIDVYAKREAIGICNYLGVTWKEPQQQMQSIDLLVEEMLADGIITSKDVWLDILKGRRTVPADWLQIAFRRAVKKI